MCQLDLNKEFLLDKSDPEEFWAKVISLQYFSLGVKGWMTALKFVESNSIKPEMEKLKFHL
jgi:hypothetical protein